MFLAGIAVIGLRWDTNAQEPLAARPLAWTQIDKPGINGEIIIAPSEINHMVTSQGVVYALDSVNGRLHRSDNGGLTFTDITTTLRTIVGPGITFNEIAVAPDSARYIAVVTNDGGGSVYLSDDNGNSWHILTQNLNIDSPGGERITCVAISTGYTIQGNSTLYHDIAIGTAKWGTGIGDGQVWTFQIGGQSGWVSSQPLGDGLGADVSAVAFSPGYAGIGPGADAYATLLAVASDGTRTCLCIKSNINGQIPTWNSASGYPKVIATEGDSNFPLVKEILSSISLPSDYVGNDPPMTRLAFVGYNRDPGTGLNDVYEINDNIDLNQPLNATDAFFNNISSISYFGTSISGKLLAGFVDPIGTSNNTAQVKWRAIDPLNPTYATWNPANQPPSGPGHAQVAWSSDGTVAFCGTGTVSGPLPIDYDESAFSQSLDNGNTWVQTALMNTSLIMTDIAPAPDSRSLFMASYSESGPESVWRSAGEPLGKYWSRLLNMPTNTDRLILRLSPNYQTDYTVYAIEADNSTTEQGLTLPPNTTSNLLQISDSRGRYWRKRSLPRPIIDVVTASQYTLYLATTEGRIRKSTDGGLTWGDKVVTELNNINMLAVSNNGHVFASSRDGWVAYSMDEGASFTKIARPVSFDMRDVQVAADANYATNDVIYASGRTLAGTDAGVWRWTIGQSTQWEQIDQAITDLGTGSRSAG